VTAEFDESLLKELRQLRENLGDIKKHAEQHRVESNQVAKSLSKIQKALARLQATSAQPPQRR